MPLPSLSILLPAWNAEATLKACLLSLLAQSEPNWECVLVDDGSLDATPEIAAQFARDDARIRVWHRPHEGLVPSLNAGLERCRGAFIARMDADDRMHPERLKKQRTALEADASLAAVGSRVELFPAHRVTRGRRDHARWLNAIESPEQVCAEAFVECPIAHPALFARSQAMKNFGYRDMGWPEDYDLVLRWLGAGLRLANVAQPLLEWRETPARLSRQSEAYAMERFTRCKASFLFEDFLERRHDYVLWGHGATGRALRKALARHGSHPTKIVEVHPRRLGETIHGAPVVSPDALPEPGETRLIASVAGTGPRSKIRAALDARGYRETVDYVCAA